MRRLLNIVLLILIPVLLPAQEIKRQYFGTVFKTTVNDNRVNVRALPTTSSQVIKQVNSGDIVYVTGFSMDREKIDGLNGYWVRISLKDNADKYWIDQNGWIFSKYIDIDKSLDRSVFKVLSVNPATARYSLSIDMQINRNGKNFETKIYPGKMDPQKFYTFTWSDDERDFTYTDPVGTFIWNPDTNEIKHVTYLGDGSESAWCYVTDDMKYLMQDYGTSPGPRGLAIFDIETNKKIYSGSHYHGLEYNGESIVVVDVYNWWNVDKKRIGAESIKYAEDFKKTTAMTDDEKEWLNEGGGVDVIIRYRFDFESKKRTYLESQYVCVQ